MKPRRALKKPRVQVVFEPHPRSTQVGVRVFAAPVKGNLLKRPGRSSAKKAAIDERLLEGFVPDHLPFSPHRPLMDKRFKRGKFHDPHQKLKKGQYQATTIFPPDQRGVFSDTSYPWCTTGKVDLGGGFGSGVLVGPRHLLCASHMMTWNANGSVNQVTFTPSYFDGNAPFGNSGITNWFAYRKVVGPNLSAADIEQDYVVLVLSNRLGDVCGYMGTRGYSDSWNGSGFWTHVGYPGDLTGGQRPTFQNGIAINSTAGNDPTDEELFHQADVWPGQSGGPFFAFWSGESFPRVVAVQSAQNSQTNLAGAGNELADLVNQARAAFP
jgi:V8-like Glu-specific endopeptidase